jgi:hypothetical protein
LGHDGDVVGFSVRVCSSLDGRRQAIVAGNAKFAPEAVGQPAVDAAVRGGRLGSSPQR